MEKFIDFKDGVSGLLVSVCVLLSVQLVFKVGEFLWKIKEKKDSASEAAIRELTEVVKQNTLALEHFESKLENVEKLLSEFPKIKLDIRRFYQAIKMISGDEWEKVKKEIEDITI